MLEPARMLNRSTVKNIFRFPLSKSGSAKNILAGSYLEAKYYPHIESDSCVTQARANSSQGLSDKGGRSKRYN